MNKFVFVYNVYNDFEDAESSITALKRHYPESRVIVIFDGTSNLGFEGFCERSDITIVHGDSLGCNKDWIQRWLQVGVDHTTSNDDWIVKFDTETDVLGRLSRIPDCDVFGCFHSTKPGFKNWTIQGGAQFIKKSAAEHLLKYGYLESPIFDSDRYISKRTEIINDSAIFTEAVKNANLFVVDHPELYFCVGFPNNLNVSRYKMIHTYKWRDRWPEPKPFKVFGVGLTKTGTLSTSKAMGTLGYKSVHYPTDPMRAARNFDALFDLPISSNFEVFDELYPGSKFIFNIRENELEWLKSLDYWYHEHIKNLIVSGWQKDLLEKGRKSMYGMGQYTTGEEILEGRRNHIKRVKEYFKDRQNDLLWFDLSKGGGWNELCGFLNEPIPTAPFPHEHNHKEDRDGYKYHWI